MKKLNKITFGKPDIGSKELKAVCKVLDSGWISTGPKVEEFEKLFKQYIGCKYVVATNSCTAALHLSLICNNIGPGDEVLVPSMTFPATVNVVEHVGAKPVFVDVENHSYNINPDDIIKKINIKTKAIIPVHLGGLPCNMKRINQIAKDYNILIIEDCAHAIGSEYENEKKVGNSKNTCCFSFYPTKNMTTGEGGMIATPNIELAEKARMYANHGLSRHAWKRFTTTSRYQLVYPGYKYNLTDINAAIGIEQLKRIKGFLKIRKKYANIYDKILQECNQITLPPDNSTLKHSWHLYSILVNNRDKIRKSLMEKGIGTGIHYNAVHLEPYYKQKYPFIKLPRTEYISKRTLSLPMQSTIDEQDVFYVTKNLLKVLK